MPLYYTAFFIVIFLLIIASSHYTHIFTFPGYINIDTLEVIEQLLLSLYDRNSFPPQIFVISITRAAHRS